MSGLALVSWLLLQVGTPELAGGELVRLPAEARLAASFEGLRDGAWLGYAVPALPGGGSCRGTLRLEGGSWEHSGEEGEPNPERFVLLSKEKGSLARVHWVDPGCRVDASGLRVSWLPEVGAAESVSFLEPFVVDDSVPEKTAREALRALAGHDVAAVTATLEGVARSGRTWKLRKQAVFWLGAARGADGARALGGLLSTETDERLLEQAVFGLHVSDAPEAESLLLAAARSHARAAVRAKALFWLAQEAGRAAAAAIAEAVREDPEHEVKERAVFALSQLPVEEGVPLLVEVARDHPDPRIKKKAFFWLGQSGDPRALEFIERVLTASP